ncbi:MATE family efflux transporter [Enterocloster clostridioformis]|uniref:MATE family efflux transporter n=1 Tax=Enterocloster clostridioformis TaxID=1531 RepID=UPI002675CDCF|nr:MATE family efflux transporter [Enterocloster clostridioformis]
MNLQTDNIHKIYFKYLIPTLFSGLVMSIYSLVDMIVVGQYEGAAGTAALACISPLWPFFCCLSTLLGNGAAVLFSNAKGAGNAKESRNIFTISFILICSISAVIWFVIAVFDEPLLRLFGADDTLMPLALRYMKWLKWGIPWWPLGYYLGMFVRNDGSPTLVGVATVCGGVFNIFGDFFLTFTCDMGIEGAAIATVVGQSLVFIIQLLHLFSKKNTIGFTRVTAFWQRGAKMMSIGLSSFMCSVGMGIVVILFNNQIMRYFGSNELAIYGVAGNLFTLIQTFSYGIGNAAQPIVAENMGSGKAERVRQTRNLGCYVAAGIGVASVVIALLFPSQIVRLYMKPSAEILAVAPSVLRRYFTCLLFLPFNVYATYYLQAVQRVKASMLVSLLQSVLLCTVFLYLFPALFGRVSIWYVMLFAEVFSTLAAILLMRKEQLPIGGRNQNSAD